MKPAPMGMSRTTIALALAIAALAVLGGIYTAGRAYLPIHAASLACEETNQIAAAALQAAQINQPSLSVRKAISTTVAVSPAPLSATTTVTLTESTTDSTAGSIQVGTAVGNTGCQRLRVPVNPMGQQDNTTLTAPTPTP